MSEELLQTKPFWIGRYAYYRLGSTTLRQLKKAKIISKQSKELNDKKPDGLIVAPGKDVKAVIEYKTPAELSTKAKIRNAIQQELAVASFLCKLLIVTDGTKTYWINATNGEEVERNGKAVSFVFDSRRIVDQTITIEEVIDLESIIDQAEFSLSSTNNTLNEPEILDPTPLAKEVWQKIWINTGKEPEKCLYNVVEIFVFKFLSDIGVLNQYNNFSSVYSRKEEVGDNEALTYYADHCRKTIKEDMFPAGEDGTTIFNGTIFVNEKGRANLSQATLFGQVLDSFQKYDSKYGSFKYVTKEFKTRLYETFLRQSAGVKNLGQFFTPRNVVQAMVKMSPASTLNKGARICDPFCGVGGFLLETILMTPRIYNSFAPVNGEVNPDISLVGYDKGTDEKDDERTIILAKANMLIYFSDLLAKYHTPAHLESFSKNAFNKVFHLLKTNLGTFGKIDDEPYDLILTNPPYVTSGSSSLKDALASDITLREYAKNNGTNDLDKKEREYYTANGRGTQALAMEWIVKNLKEGGTALVVVPDSLLLQENMLNYIRKNCLVEGIISLPLRTFYTTAQKTYILIIQKRDRRIEESSQVFAYLVSEIGETRDSKRFYMEQNHLTEAAYLFNLFKTGNPLPHSPRCKLIPYPVFSTLQNWLIDRQWTIEEKQTLGIEEEKSTISEEDFWGLIDDMKQYLCAIRGEKTP